MSNLKRLDWIYALRQHRPPALRKEYLVQRKQAIPPLIGAGGR